MDPTINDDSHVRYRYKELTGEDDVGSGALIYDPDNDDAWIRSTRAVPVPDNGSPNLRNVMQYDQVRDAYHLEYDWRANEPLSMLIIFAVADLAGDSPLELEPLYDQIDPDALDRLFSPRADGSLGAEGPVSFTFHGYEVTVKRHGHLIISPPDSSK